MHKLFSLTLFILAISYRFNNNAFTNFMTNCNKTYTNTSETLYRSYIFYKNLDYINYHNLENNGYQLEMNCFGDMSCQEFSDKILMYFKYINTR